jgi:hypothetical protein
MITQEEKEAERKIQEAQQVVENTQRARDLARKILEAKEYKALLDKEIKEATEELTQIATENPDWFKNEEGKVMKSCNLGVAKLAWRSQSPSYYFNHKDINLIGKFIETYPESAKIEFRKMDNIELDEFGIEVKTFQPKLNVEKSDEV